MPCLLHKSVFFVLPSLANKRIHKYAIFSVDAHDGVLLLAASRTQASLLEISTVDTCLSTRDLAGADTCNSIISPSSMLTLLTHLSLITYKKYSCR